MSGYRFVHTDGDVSMTTTQECGSDDAAREVLLAKGLADGETIAVFRDGEDRPFAVAGGVSFDVEAGEPVEVAR